MKLRFWYLLTGATRSSYTTWLLLPQVVHKGPPLALTRFVFLQDTAVTEPRLNISVAKSKPGRWSRPASTSSKNRYAQQVRWSSVSAVFTHFCPGPVNFSHLFSTSSPTDRQGRSGSGSPAATAPASNTAKQVLAEIERVMDPLVAGRAKEAQLYVSSLMARPQSASSLPRRAIVWVPLWDHTKYPTWFIPICRTSFTWQNPRRTCRLWTSPRALRWTPARMAEHAIRCYPVTQFRCILRKTATGRHIGGKGLACRRWGRGMSFSVFRLGPVLPRINLSRQLCAICFQCEYLVGSLDLWK